MERPWRTTAPATGSSSRRELEEIRRKFYEVIALLNRNIRTRRLAEVLKAYTLASQACRKEASP